MSAELELIARLRNEAKAGIADLRGGLKDMGVSAEKSSLQLAAVKQQSQLLESKTNELARAVAKGEKSFEDAERELVEYKSGLRDMGQEAERAEQKTKELDRATGTASKGFGAMEVALGNLVADGLRMAADAVVDFVAGSIDLASNAAETTSLLENSLGPAAVGFSQDIDQIAEATKRSSIELEAGASTIVAMTKSMGFGQQAAADFSASMALIATDLGSFFNQSTEQVFEDLQSALAGSAETMLKYGIDVKETALQQAALRMGLVDSMGPLDRVTRATVLQAEIVRQAADAMGDAELTADSFSNTQRGMEAATLDLQAAIGERLIPAMYDLTVASTDVVRGFNDMLTASELSTRLKMVAFNYEEIHKAIVDLATDDSFWDPFKSHRREVELTREVLILLESGVKGTAEELIGYAQAAIAADMRAEAMNREFKNSVVVNEDLAEAIEETTRLTVEQSRAITNATLENHTYEVSAEQVEEAERRRAAAHEAAAEAAELAAEATLELEQRTAGYFSASLPAIESTDSWADEMYEAAEAAGASAGELAELGVGLGLFDEAAANSALQAAAIRIKIDELAQSYADGEISQLGMRTELQNFIAVLNGEYTASVGGATTTAGLLTDEIGEQKGIVGGTREEIERYNRILSGETVTAAQNAATAYAEISTGALEGKLGVDGLAESSLTFADNSPYEAEYSADTEAAGQEIDILKGKADDTAGDYGIHFNVTSDPFPQPTGGGATGGGTGDLPAPAFQHGGFTGHGTGFAGLVHHNEFVFNPEATRNIGVGLLERLHDAARGGPRPGGPGPPLFIDSSPSPGTIADFPTADTVAGSRSRAGGRSADCGCGDFIYAPVINISSTAVLDERRIMGSIQQELQRTGRDAEAQWRMRR